MDLLARARQLEQEFEAKKAGLRELEIKQAMTKEQFVQQKEMLAAKGTVFNTGAELKAIYTAQEQRLRDLINTYDEVKARAHAQPTQAENAQVQTAQPTAQVTTPPVQPVQPTVQATTPPVQTVQPTVQATTPPVQTAQPTTQATTPPVQTAQPTTNVTPPPAMKISTSGAVPANTTRNDIPNVFDVDFEGIF